MGDEPKKPRQRRSPIFVDRAEVKEALGLATNAALDRYVERGWCPPPCRWLTPRRPVWGRRAWERWLRVGIRDPDGPGPADADAELPRSRSRSSTFVDRPEVRRVLGLATNAVLARHVEQGLCPPPDRWLNPRRPAWYRESFERWLRLKGQPPAE